MTTTEVLKQSIVEGNTVRLPDIKLERKEYLEVKKALELIGGKWKGGKIQGFVFEEDPTELLAAQANGDGRNLKKEYQFFATPEDLAMEMVVELPAVLPGHQVLEPSAGDGAIIKVLFDNTAVINVDCYEAMDLNRMKLKKLNEVSFAQINILGDDFLQCDRYDYYDYIIANPPFTRNQDIIHIAKMYQCLKPGGIIVTVSSVSWLLGSQKIQQDFRDWLDELEAVRKEIDAGVFKESGTGVKSTLLKITKPETDAPAIPESIIQKIQVPQGRVSVPDDEKEQEEIEEAVDSIEDDTKKVRTCRVCGCTDDDCRQCIKKTGHPCHWVEEDLCSACVERSPEEIMQDIRQNMKEADKTFKDLEQMLLPKSNDMNFFEQLATAGDVDITLRIMKKNERLTLSVMPGSGQSTTSPILITGTPGELDAKFFSELYPEVQEVAGIIHNIEEVKKEALQKKEENEKKPAAAGKKTEKTKDRKVSKKGKKEPERVGLFDDDADNISNDQTENDERANENDAESVD